MAVALVVIEPAVRRIRRLHGSMPDPNTLPPSSNDLQAPSAYVGEPDPAWRQRASVSRRRLPETIVRRCPISCVGRTKLRSPRRLPLGSIRLTPMRGWSTDCCATPAWLAVISHGGGERCPIARSTTNPVVGCGPMLRHIRHGAAPGRGRSSTVNPGCVRVPIGALSEEAIAPTTESVRR